IDDIDGLGRVVFCHATPRNDVDVMTKETPLERMRAHLSTVEADVVVCGHTHMQFDRHVDRIRVVNAGSVGMPYGEPGAYWTMLGPGVRARRTEYDLEEAARRARAGLRLNAARHAGTSSTRRISRRSATSNGKRMIARTSSSSSSARAARASGTGTRKTCVRSVITVPPPARATARRLLRSVPSS